MNDTFLDDEIQYQLVRLIEENPNISQRELAVRLGVSLGKVNYCMKALINIGWIKAGNFVRSSNKRGYAYIITPAGIKEKARIAARFLKRKQAQYERLKVEIMCLQREVEGGDFSAEGIESEKYVQGPCIQNDVRTGNQAIDCIVDE